MTAALFQPQCINSEWHCDVIRSYGGGDGLRRWTWARGLLDLAPVWAGPQGWRKFSLCHMNIRSMSKNIHQFETYLDLLKHRFTVIGLTETWLKDSNCDLYGIKGYHLIEKHRKSQGGGVAVCIKDHLNYFERPDVSLFESDLEFS